MFKYFNPIWIINHFLQPSLGPEILVPAAIGAVGSAAMGKSPVTGALLGGATGGLFGGAGGNLFSGFKSALPSATGTGVQLAPTVANTVDDLALNSLDDIAFNTSLPTNVVGGAGQGINISPYLNVADDGLGFAASGAPATGIPFSFPSTPNPLTIDPRRMVVDTPLTLGERVSDFGSNIIPNATSYVQQNPMVALGGAQSLLDIRQRNQMIDEQKLRNAAASVPPIRQGQSGPMAGNLLQVRRIG